MKDIRLIRLVVYIMLCMLYVIIIANMKVLVGLMMPYDGLFVFMSFMLYACVHH